MPKTSRHRWKGWRVNESGRSIKSNPKKDSQRPGKAQPVKARRAAIHEQRSWIVYARKGSKCDDCREPVADQPAVFCYPDRAVFCLLCAEQKGIDAQPSKSYLKRQAA